MTTDKRRRALRCVTKPGGKNTRHVSPKMRAIEKSATTDLIVKHVNNCLKQNAICKTPKVFRFRYLTLCVRIWRELWAKVALAHTSEASVYWVRHHKGYRLHRQSQIPHHYRVCCVDHR